MPYILTQDRDRYDHLIKSILVEFQDLTDDQVKGHLNYIIYSIIYKHIQQRGMKYARLQDLIGGTLTSCQQELYRKVMAPYEDIKEKENGPII